MEQVLLAAQVREGAGKKIAKQIRATGSVPAVVYGTHTEAVSLTVSEKAFQAVIHTGAGENAVISLNIEGGAKPQKETVRVKEVQHDPVTDRVKHVDFQAISLTEKMESEVPIHEKGESIGVKEGGILDHVHRTVKVECLPTAIPDAIIVTIDELNVNDAIHVKDLQMPEGVVCLLDPEEVVLKILPPKVEEEPAEEGAEGEVTEPEVITEKKTEEAGEESADKPKEKKKDS
jgi:large subunit ribosomal protein L25